MMKTDGERTTSNRSWGDILARSAKFAFRTVPLAWAMAFVPLVFDNALTVRNAVGALTVGTVVGLPLLFGAGVFAQSMPRNWYRKS
jgi:hypothetical protein